MYKYALYCATALLLFCLAAALFFVRTKDVETYTQLMESSRPMQKNAVIAYAEQERKGVYKELYLRKENSPLHVRIESDTSELFIFHEENKMEVVEEMHTVRCMLQEELYFESGNIPMQTVRYLEAEKASYNYNTNSFIAENVKLWRYRTLSHEPRMDFHDERPLMTGTADSVEFNLSGDDLNFVAHHMRARFDTKGGLR